MVGFGILHTAAKAYTICAALLNISNRDSTFKIITNTKVISLNFDTSKVLLVL